RDYKGPPSIGSLWRMKLNYENAVVEAGFDYKASIDGQTLVSLHESPKDRKTKDRERWVVKRQARIAEGLCPQCGGDWIEPEETHRGKPKHCRKCQIYYKGRHSKK
ncbi:MAG: hypothetical protein K0Q73_4052, partial [Paenibacillus sp.]|nr:hypothetical protein [Paenibacillus sp.]